MKTIRIKVYRFKELNEKAQEKAIQAARAVVDTTYIYDYAYESVKAFHKLFGTREGGQSWLDVKCNHLEDSLLLLKGVRLRTYIVNNFGAGLYKGKYYNSWASAERVPFRKVKSVLKTKANGWNVEEKHGAQEYWNVYKGLMLEKGCVLTGVTYDDSLLQPVYDFIEKYKERADYNSYQDFENLMGECFASLQKDIEREVEYRESEEALREDIEANDLQFLKDGTQYI